MRFSGDFSSILNVCKNLLTDLMFVIAFTSEAALNKRILTSESTIEQSFNPNVKSHSFIIKNLIIKKSY